MTNHKKSAVVYARVSTARQADDGLPVESQLEQCKNKAESLDARVAKVFRDDGISGRTSNRPGFMAALDFCEDHQTDFFICWSSSRFARNHVDAAIHKRVLAKSGTKLVFVSQDFGESDESWMIESIVAIMDEQYSRAIAKDTRRSMAKNAEDGFWNGGRVPYGFKSVPFGKRRRLEPVSEETAVVKMIFRWCNEGSGQKDIAVRLNQIGIARRGAPWNKTAVGAVLSNRVAIGQIVFNDRGREIVTNSHEAIVSEDVFNTAQIKIAGRRPANTGGRSRSEAALSGFLRCGKCGEAMMTETATGRNGARHHYYNCRSFLKGMGCHSRRVRVDRLDDLVINAVSSDIFTAKNLATIIAEVKEQTSQWAKDKQLGIDSLAAELVDVDRRLRRLYESIEAGSGLELNDVAPRLRELRARQAAIKQEIEEIDSQVGPVVAVSERDTEATAKLFREILLTAESPRKVREFLGTVLEKIVLRDEDAMIGYLPSRIVSAEFGGSQCGVRWLPDASTLRTKKQVRWLTILLPWKSRKAA